jgi:hypothetical protein
MACIPILNRIETNQHIVERHSPVQQWVGYAMRGWSCPGSSRKAGQVSMLRENYPDSSELMHMTSN